MGLTIAFVSMHTSPVDTPGAGDAGGMNVVELGQASALAALGHRVELITRQASPEAATVVDLAPGVILRHLPAGPAGALPKSEIDAHIEEFSAGLAHLAGFDLVHSHHWMSGVAAVPVAQTWGVPHVQSYHSVAALPGSPLSEGEPPESGARVAGEAYVARESDAIVAVSTAEARTVIERCGADPDRVRVVPPGVDLALFHPAAPGEQSPRPASPNGYVLFAARLQPLKGADLAIQALAAVPSGVRPDLVIAGDTSADFASYEDEVTEIVRDQRLGQQVHFVGPQKRPELAALMRHCRAFLVPSHSETFGLVALEAAASGVPVLASSTGGLREVVVHEETGFLLHDRDPARWGAVLTRLLTDEPLRARLSTVARVHARRFVWRDLGRRLAAIYEEVLALHQA